MDLYTRVFPSTPALTENSIIDLSGKVITSIYDWNKPIIMIQGVHNYLRNIWQRPSTREYPLRAACHCLPWVAFPL